MRRRTLHLSWRVALVVALMIVVAGVGAAGVYCKFYADCHIGPRTTVNDFVGRGGGTTHLPAGFRQEVVARGLGYPTDFTELPDGRILVAEKNGLLVAVTPGKRRLRTVLDLTSRVNSNLFRGLVAVRADPHFQRNRRFYVVYANRGSGSRAATTVTFSRFVLEPTAAATRATEHVVLGKMRGGSCLKPGTPPGCLPAEVDHIGAEVTFGTDGSLFLSTGDGGGLEHAEPDAYLAQSLNWLGGKVLHIDANGNGLPDNPWWNGNPRSNRSRIWAIGLRNPFRMTTDPRTGILYVGDVGWRRWDELDAVTRGSNLGWPCREGPVPSPPAYSGSTQCKAFHASAATPPLLSFKHPAYVTFVGGAFYEASVFPARFRGAYFFGDWVRGVIELTRISRNGRHATPPVVFARPVAGPTSIQIEPDGSLLYTAANLGELRRISYAG